MTFEVIWYICVFSFQVFGFDVPFAGGPRDAIRKHEVFEVVLYFYTSVYIFYLFCTLLGKYICNKAFPN